MRSTEAPNRAADRLATFPTPPPHLRAKLGPSFLVSVGGDDFVERGAHLPGAQPDIDGDGAGTVIEPAQMLLDQHQSAVVEPDALPHAVAEAETGIEDRDDCLGAGHEPPVEPDQEVAIARILSGGLRPFCLDHRPILASQSPRQCGGLDAHGIVANSRWGYTTRRRPRVGLRG